MEASCPRRLGGVTMNDVTRPLIKGPPSSGWSVVRLQYRGRPLGPGWAFLQGANIRL